MACATLHLHENNPFGVDETCLLLQDMAGDDESTFLQGTLFQFNGIDNIGNKMFKPILLNERTSTTLRTTVSVMSPVIEEEVSLILPLKPPQRIKVFMNKLWLEQLCELKIGDEVIVFNKVSLQNEVTGTIRYIGPLAGKHGRWFGVALDEQYRKMGVHNGKWQGQQLFECTGDGGFFVNAFQIKPKLSRYTGINLDIGQPVITWLSNEGTCESGSVKWLGFLDSVDKRVGRHIDNIMVGIELDNPVGTGTGKYNKKQIFLAKKGYATLIPIMGLIPSTTSAKASLSTHKLANTPKLGLMQNEIANISRTSRNIAKLYNKNDAACKSISKTVDDTEEDCDHDMNMVDNRTGLLNRDIMVDADQQFGMYEGIQGKDNSCYLDSVIFALYRYSGVLDYTLVYVPRNESKEHVFVRRSLVAIVDTLRRESYVPADMMRDFRKGVGSLFPSGGFIGDMRDPEEFIDCLFGKCLRLQPFLEMNTGQKAFIHQLLPDVSQVKSRGSSVQNLLFQSFLRCNIQLLSMPSLLLLQMPRYNAQSKLFEHVFPDLVIDLDCLLAGCAKKCCLCDDVADLQCAECMLSDSNQMISPLFCAICCRKSHSNSLKSTHHIQTLPSPNSPTCSNKGVRSSTYRTTMELFAVICIRTSHYVCFVKSCKSDPYSWVFFDSMASVTDDDNIVPRVSACPEVGEWLKDGNITEICEDIPDTAPTSVRRLLTDAYMCLYQQ